MSRNIESLMAGMEPSLAELYCRLFPQIKEAVKEYFPDSISPAYLNKVCAQDALFSQDMPSSDFVLMQPTREYLASGGKMLRPVLVGLVLEAYGKTAEEYLPFMASIEVMEDSSIMMDDYIDNSLMRRGTPCAHISHGFPLANLSSISAFASAHHLFYNNEMNLDIGLAAGIMDAFSWEHVQMAYGQIEELYWTVSNVNTVSIPEYLQETIARCAFLSFRGPLRYAGMVGEAPPEDIPVLEALGDYLLIGYHVRGDNLDMLPDSPAWGKIAGEDITTGRRTLLINYVLEQANPDDRHIIEEILDSRTRDEELKKIVYKLVLKYDGFSYTRKLAEEYNLKAQEQIGKLHIDQKYKDLLNQFSNFAAQGRKV